MNLKEPEGTLQCLLSRKEVQKLSISASPPQGEASILQSRQYVCSNIQPPRKIYCSELEEFILGPQKDLVCQLVQGAQTQTSLLVDIRDHRFVFGAHQHMAMS